MKDEPSAQQVEATDVLRGGVEPHAQLLKQPDDSQRLYKIVKVPYFLDMLHKNYLHFQRVDTYQDDTFDGEQLPSDKELNQKLALKNPPRLRWRRISIPAVLEHMRAVSHWKILPIFGLSTGKAATSLALHSSLENYGRC